MSNKKLPKEAPLASIAGPTETFNLTKNELEATLFNTNVMSDYGETTLINLRKFHKNAKYLRDVLIDIEEDKKVLDALAFKFNTDIWNNEAVSQEEKDAKKLELEKSYADFFKVQHPVVLYVLKSSEFPSDSKKYGTRPYYVAGNDQPQTVKYVSSFLDLQELEIIKD